MSYWNTRDGPEKSTKFQEVDKKGGRMVKVANLEEKVTYKFQVRSYQEFGDNLVLGPQSQIHSVTIGKPNVLADSFIKPAEGLRIHTQKY